MEYRTFGKTGKKISVFTLGGMRFLHGDGLVEEELREDSLENTHQVITTAFAAGFNLIETARGYGKSERLIGRTLPHLSRSRDSYHVMTKAPPVETAGEMRRMLETSLERLALDHVDFFAVHGLNLPEHLETARRPGGYLDGLRRAREEGLIGHIGFSTHGPLPVILAAIDSDFFEFVNLHYYAFRPGLEPAVKRAAQQDMGVLIISPNDKGGRLYEPPRRLAELTAPLHPVQYNERWLLAQPEVHTLSIGMNQPDQLQIHLDSLDRPCPDERDETIHQRLQRAAAASPTRHCGVCAACLPCPRGIEIPEVLRLEHLSATFDMRFFGRYRYSLMIPGNHWVPGAAGNACDRCGDCLPRCPENLDIPSLLFTTHRRLRSFKKSFIEIAAKIHQRIPPSWIDRLAPLIALLRRWLTG